MHRSIRFFKKNPTVCTVALPFVATHVRTVTSIAFSTSTLMTHSMHAFIELDLGVLLARPDLGSESIRAEAFHFTALFFVATRFSLWLEQGNKTCITASPRKLASYSYRPERVAEIDAVLELQEAITCNANQN